MNGWESLGWGLFGGIAAELAVLFQIRHQLASEAPYWLRSWVYWTIAALMVVAGGVIVLAHARSGTELSPLLAIQVGASAPLILRKLREVVPDKPELPDANRID